ncbi:MAG: c-type cytochrome [Rhizomicrobium sp.]
MRTSLGLFGAIALLLAGVPGALAAPVALDVMDGGKKMAGDPAHGKAIFNRCMVCHSIDAGVNHIGPSLHGVVGRKAGSVPNFMYSGANKKSGIVWTEQKIYDYLKNPQMMVPGTKMTFPGLPKPQDRADVVSYLKTNSK